MDFKSMTNDELITLQNTIRTELKKREEEKAHEAIENFRKAFEEVKKVVYEIRVEEGWNDDYYCIEDFEQFHFEI